jgi:hypothetical protein
MSPDEVFIVALLRGLKAVDLEAIIIGNAAAAIQGAPVTTQDIDLLVRDTPRNRQKIERLSETLGAARPVSIGPLTSAQRITGGAWPIDILFETMSGDLGFASVRSRSRAVPIADVTATVASLEDVIASKEAAGRPKDLAVLPILRDVLRVMHALDAKPP